MPARRFAMFGQESSYGTPNLTAGAPTTNTYGYFRLSEGEASFKAEETPLVVPIMYGGGRPSPVERVSDQFEGRFTFETLLFPALTQAGILLPWAITPINSGRTTPWVTTGASGVMPPGDLASIWFGEAVEQSDASYEYTIYTGAKCETWDLMATDTGDGRKWKLRAAGRFKQRSSSTVTHVPVPAETAYPTGPYLLSHLTGATGIFKVGVTRIGIGQIMSINASGRNVLDPRFYEATRMASCRFTGRNCAVKAGLRLKLTPDDRAALTAGTSMDTQLILDNGTRTMAPDLQDSNKIQVYDRKFPNGEFTYDVEVQNYWDNTAATDVTVVVA